MSTFSRNLRSGIRSLRKTPGTTLVILLAMALGIGANTAIFSLVDAVMLRPLPYDEPDRIVSVWQTAFDKGFDRLPVAVGDFYYWQEDESLFDDLALYRIFDVNLTGGGEPESLDAVEVTSEFFGVLGIEAAVGRTFAPGEDRAGGESLAVLTDGIWRRLYGGDPEVVGRDVMIDDEPYTVIGVLPPGLRTPGIGDFQVAIPTAFTDQDREIELRFGYQAVGRLAEGVSIEQARSRLTAMARQLESAHPQVREGIGIGAELMAREVVQDIRPALVILIVAVVFVLLIACANAANLLLARALDRSREVAMRAVLGAGRSSIVAQFLTESMLLSVTGGLLGLVVAALLVPALVALSPADLPQLEDAGLSPLALLFTLGVAVLTGILFGIVPALRGSKVGVGETLKESSRSASGGVRAQRFRSVLVVAEVALALILLIGAGLMIQSLMRLQRVDPGFRPDHLLTLELSLPDARYPESSQVTAFFERAIERVESLPGVETAGGISELPFSEAINTQLFTIENQPAQTMDEVPSSDFRQVTPGYVEAMGISLLQGRGFGPQDTPDAPPAVLVNETLARRHFPGGDAVGKRLRIGVPESIQPSDGEPPPWMTVVGVVGDVRHTSLREPAAAEIYALHPQSDSPRSSLFLVARTQSEPGGRAQAVREAIWALDPNLPVANVQTMDELMAETTTQTRFLVLLLGFFAATALVLAVMGIYGTLSYFVSRRTQEIGLRMAMGAERGHVLRLIVRQAMTLAGIGLLVGLAGAFALTRRITNQLFEVEAHDPTTFVAISALLALTAAVAAALPALRASRLEPVIALRYE